LRREGRARRELEQLASVAKRCGCAPTQSRSDAVVVQIRQARDANSRRKLRDIANQTIPIFDEAMLQHRHIPRRRPMACAGSLRRLLRKAGYFVPAKIRIPAFRKLVSHRVLRRNSRRAMSA
jgi:hypothetical protein